MNNFITLRAKRIEITKKFIKNKNKLPAALLITNSIMVVASVLNLVHLSQTASFLLPNIISYLLVGALPVNFMFFLLILCEDKESTENNIFQYYIKKHEKLVDSIISTTDFSTVDNPLRIKALIAPQINNDLEDYIAVYKPTKQQTNDVLHDNMVSLKWKLAYTSTNDSIPITDEMFESIDIEKPSNLLDFFMQYKKLSAANIEQIQSRLTEREKNIFKLHLQKNVETIHPIALEILQQKTKMENLGIDDPTILDCEILLKDQIKDKRDIEVERVLRENKALHKYLKSST